MRILVAEDEPISRRLLDATLRRAGYQPTFVNDGAEARAALEAPDAPRLAILDWLMPRVDGIEVCRWLRARSGAPYTYVMLLTSRGGVESLVEGLEAGADDFMVKPFNGAELQARLRAGSRILITQAGLEAARRTLEHQATHDALTGIFNRAAILGHLDRDLARAARDGSPLSVLMVDLDRFKRINDQHGHLAGDAVLRAAAARLRGALRAADAIGRYGGEEFLVTLPGCGTIGAAAVAERLRAAVSRDPIACGGAMLHATCSIGVATGGPGEAVSSAALIAAADGALYRAKREGRDRIRVAEARSSEGDALAERTAL